MPRSEESEALFIRSGQFTTDDKLVSFLYQLMRDEVPAGVLERIVQESQTVPASLTNGNLARYAEDLASRLKAHTP